MSDYFFQQPDEEEKREYLRRELERMQREADMNGAQTMPVPPPAQQSPPIGRGFPVQIDGLSSPDLGPEAEESPIDSAIRGALNTAVDFTPVVGDAKGFIEAQSPMDYVFAAAGLIPVVGDSLKAAHKAKKAAESQKRYERYHADTWTPGHRGIEDSQHAGVRERMGREFLDSDLPEYIDEIAPEDLEAMSPAMRRLWKALERDDYLGFDRTDDLMSTLTKADEEMLIENFDLSPQLKAALGRYINEQYK